MQHRLTRTMLRQKRSGDAADALLWNTVLSMQAVSWLDTQTRCDIAIVEDVVVHNLHCRHITSFRIPFASACVEFTC
mgnify:CR=1 FL=1